MERLPLTKLPAALAEAGYFNPGYRSLYEAARSARMPGVSQDRAGRWFFDALALDNIAEALGLTDVAAA